MTPETDLAMQKFRAAAKKIERAISNLERDNFVYHPSYETNLQDEATRIRKAIDALFRRIHMPEIRGDDDAREQAYAIEKKLRAAVSPALEEGIKIRQSKRYKAIKELEQERRERMRADPYSELSYPGSKRSYENPLGRAGGGALMIAGGVALAGLVFWGIAKAFGKSDSPPAAPPPTTEPILQQNPEIIQVRAPYGMP